MTTYVRKNHRVEAIQFTKENFGKCLDFIGRDKIESFKKIIKDYAAIKRIVEFELHISNIFFYPPDIYRIKESDYIIKEFDMIRILEEEKFLENYDIYHEKDDDNSTESEIKFWDEQPQNKKDDLNLWKAETKFFNPNGEEVKSLTCCLSLDKSDTIVPFPDLFLQCASQILRKSIEFCKEKHKNKIKKLLDYIHNIEFEFLNDE